MARGTVFWSLATLLTVALTIRLGASVLWQQRLGDARAFAFPDSHSYWHLGQRLAHGESYQYGPDYQVFRTPAYPLLLAGLFQVTGADPPVVWARALNAVLGTLAVAGIYWVGRLLFDGRVAWWAGWLACWYPGAIGMSVFVLAEALFAPLMVAQLGCWIAARQRDSGWRRSVLWALGAGLLGGLATLTRPSWLLFTPGAAGLLLVFGSRRRRDAVVAALVVLALVLTMVPWWVRNVRVTGRFVPTTLQVGASLYDGWNPRATGASDMWFSEPFARRQRLADGQRGEQSAGTFETRLNQRLLAAAVQWAVDHPVRVLELAGQKFVRTWTPWPAAAVLGDWQVRALTAVGYVPILVLGVWGCYRFAGRGGSYALCYLPALYVTGLHLVFVGSVRYRQPAVLMLTVLAAAVLVHGTRRGAPAAPAPADGA